MKNLILFLTILGGAFSFSGHATVVAEDTAEHTINFTFGRPTEDVYLCWIRVQGPYGEPSPLDTITFSNGDKINGDCDSTQGCERNFTKGTAPSSSTLNLGSANYGTSVEVVFCHDFQVPSENPGGQIDTFYKIFTPSNIGYFTNSQLAVEGGNWCNEYGISQDFSKLYLSSNTSTDYQLSGSLPFGVGVAIRKDPNQDPRTCHFGFWLHEESTGPRASGETTGNVTFGVKNQINYN